MESMGDMSKFAQRLTRVPWDETRKTAIGFSQKMATGNGSQPDQFMEIATQLFSSKHVEHQLR